MTAHLQLPERAFTTSADADEVTDLILSALADGTVVTIDLVDGALLLNGAATVAVTVSAAAGDAGAADTGGGVTRTSKMGRMAAPGTGLAPAPDEEDTTADDVGVADSGTDDATSGEGTLRTSKMGRHGTGQLAVGASAWRLASAESPEFRLREAMETGRVVQVDVLDDAGAPARLLLRGHGLGWAALTAG